MAGGSLGRFIAAQDSRRSLVVAAGVAAAVAIAAGVVLGLGALRGGTHRARPTSSHGQAAGSSTLLVSAYGYPDGYITHSLPYKVHPPLPVSGWHGPARPLDFDVLFHSVFHGYLVAVYRSDLPQADRGVTPFLLTPQLETATAA